MIHWRIYYADGSTYDNETGPASAAPPLGVQVIAQAHKALGRVLVTGGDYYWRHQGEWFAGDIAGVYTFLVANNHLQPGTEFAHPIAMLEWMAGTGLVKLGQMLRGDRYTAIYHRAYDDPDLPKKTAWHPNERKGP